MGQEELFYLYDDTENTKTRFVSFMGKTNRFDLALTTSNRFYGKVLVLDLQSNRFGIIGSDDLEEEGYLEHLYNLSEEEADELREFLSQCV